MIRNLFRVAWRAMQKDKAYSLLNILGLTIGISFSVLLIFYVLDELSYDRYNEKAGRIYRIVSYVNEPTNKMKWAATQYPLRNVLQQKYQEVEQAARFVGADKAMYKNGEIKFYEDKLYYADSNLFNIFTYSFLEGNPKTALVEPHSLVMTQSMAKRYFGTAPALGKTIQDNHGENFKVTAVIKDVPSNSHIRFAGLISTSTLPPDFSDNWGSFGHFTYVLLKPNVNAKAFEKKLLPLYNEFMAPIFKQFNIEIHYGVQPITAIHLHSEFSGEPEELGSMSYIYIFSAVALFMLIISCINYMNLATARSARRAKEIGIRKVAGSLKSQLVAQFLAESMLMAFLALVLSLGVIYLLLPAFNNISGKSIAFLTLFQAKPLLILLAVFLFVGLAGGSYPAFYLARFNPVTVLKGTLSKSSSNTALRKVLVTAQFAISIVMLICTLVVYRQLKFMQNKDLGFNKDQVLNVRVDADGNFRQTLYAFEDEVRRNPQVVSVSTGQATPGGDGNSFNLFSIQTKGGFVDKGIDCYAIDGNYISTLGMKVVAGRNFSPSIPADTLNSILVNEAMAKAFGWDEPLGKIVKFPGDTSGRHLEVVGVIRDFNLKSLYNPIAPLILFYRPISRSVQIKVTPANIAATTSQLENTWKSFFPALPFQYSFLDQDLDSQYKADQKRGKLFLAFSSLTIFITCLGLLGLTAFTTQQRQKEISVRKVMGARVPQLVSLIAKNFLALAGLSALIAFPVAWYFMHRWLDAFPYKTSLGFLPFLMAILIVLAITLLTVSYHTVRAAMANPSKNLRTE